MSEKNKKQTIQHYRTNISGNTPTPDNLEYGEIAVCYDSVNPSLFIKDSEDDIVKINVKNSFELLNKPFDVINDVYDITQLRVVNNISKDDYLNKDILLNGKLTEMAVFKKFSFKYECTCEYYVFKSILISDVTMCAIYYKRPYDDDEGIQDDLCFKYKFASRINNGFNLPLYVRRLFSNEFITTKGLKNKTKKLIKKLKKDERILIPGNTTFNSPFVYRGETKLFEYHNNYNGIWVSVIDNYYEDKKQISLDGKLLIEGCACENLENTFVTKIYPNLTNSEYMCFVCTKYNNTHPLILNTDIGQLKFEIDGFNSIFHKKFILIKTSYLREIGAQSIAQDGSTPYFTVFVLEDARFYQHCCIIRNCIDRSSSSNEYEHVPFIKVLNEPINDKFIYVKKYNRNICTDDRSLSYYDKRLTRKSDPLYDRSLFNGLDIDTFFCLYEIYAKCKRHNTHKWSRFFMNKKNVVSQSVACNFDASITDYNFIFKCTLLRAIYNCGKIDLVNNKRKVYLDMAIFERLGYRKKATYNEGLRIRVFLGPFEDSQKLENFVDLLSRSVDEVDVDVVNEVDSFISNLHIRVIGAVKKSDILKNNFIV